MQILLETARLRLRQFTEADVDELVRLDGDPAVMRFINGGRPTPRAEIENDILPRLLTGYQRLPGYGRWAAVEKASGQFIGWFSLRLAEHSTDRAPELGYRLCSAVWGNGYATEGSRALVHKGFTELGMERVWAQTMTVNTASRRVLEKVGMRLVRTFHQDWPDVIEGGEHGDVEYALTRTDWQHQQLPGPAPGRRTRRY